MAASLTQFAKADGPGSVTGAPDLPIGFTDTFTSHYIDSGAVRLHAVVGGSGPALLLVHGWPENWYAWRHLMPALAQDFTVIAVDQRGIGLSDKPETGYDTGTLATDLVGLMDALGHEQFAVVGHDTGFAISYALVADYPERVSRAVLAEIPGAPGTTPAPPFFVPAPVNDRLWHLSFNRVETLPEQLITGREDVFFGYEFAVQGGSLPAEVIAYTWTSSPTRTPCAEPSGSTAHSMRRSHRTPSALVPGSPSPCSASAESRATATTSPRRCKRWQTTCRASSSPAQGTGWPKKRQPKCSPP